jgi:hypothetical protein
MSLYQRNPLGYGLWVREKADIQGLRGKDRFMTYYSFCCEMKEQYPPALLAQCLGIPVIYVRMLMTLHRLKNIGRK